MTQDKLRLPEVTLACIDSVNPELALDAMRRCLAQCEFARAVLFTSAPVAAPAGIEVVVIPPITSKRAYSVFLVKALAEHIATPHVLIVQWDGFVVNTTAWDPRFLEYDYIGAPWPPDLSTCQVGNGGFSLRSRRLLEALRDPVFPEEQIVHEDQAICNLFRQRLEDDFGIRFAPPELAARFSHETVQDGKPTFGFHGPQNLWLYWNPDELDRFLALVSRPVLRTPEVVWLARHLLSARRLRETAKVAGAALVEQPANTELLDILGQLRELAKGDDYMARSEQRFFLGNLKRNLPACFRQRLVLELSRPWGTTNVREWFDDCQIIQVPDGGGAELYPARSASFDTIVSCGALEYLPRWQDVVRNAQRLLKRDGLLVITCAGIGRRKPLEAPASFRSIDPAELMSLFDGISLAALALLEDRSVHDIYLMAAGPDAPAEVVTALRQFAADQRFVLHRRNAFGLP